MTPNASCNWYLSCIAFRDYLNACQLMFCICPTFRCVCVCVCERERDRERERKVVEMDKENLFYVLLTAHPNIMIVFFFLPTWYTNSLFQYIYYIPLHVSSTIVLIFRRTIVLIQLSSWRWAQLCSKHVQECNKCIKIKNLCIELVKKRLSLKLVFRQIRWQQNNYTSTELVMQS